MVTPPGSRLTPSLAQRQVWQERGLRRASKVTLGKTEKTQQT